MILRFVAKDAEPGENMFLNLCTDKETYNFKCYHDKKYIPVSRVALSAIREEIDFNCYYFEEDLLTGHLITRGDLEEEEKRDAAREKEEEPDSGAYFLAE